MSWLCCKKHPEVFWKCKTLPLDVLLKDPIVHFHKKYKKYYKVPVPVASKNELL
jgi:hypothetical protein